MGTAVLLQVLALFTPFAKIVNVVPVPLWAVAITVLVAFVIPLAVFELYKKLKQ